MAISALQLTMARAALKWGVRTLADKAGISPDSVTRAEQGGDVTVKTWGAIQRALEDGGIEFLPEVNSVSLHADVTEGGICADPEMPLGTRRIYPRFESTVHLGHQMQFPIPNAGRMMVTPLASDKTFSVECTGLSRAERDLLMGFFMQMRGRFGSFRFEYGKIRFAECRFDSDTGPWMDGGPGPYSLTFPIKILRAGVV